MFGNPFDSQRKPFREKIDRDHDTIEDFNKRGSSAPEIAHSDFTLSEFFSNGFKYFFDAFFYVIKCIERRLQFFSEFSKPFDQFFKNLFCDSFYCGEYWSQFFR